MAQIKSGLASVSNGSAIVTGSSTIWQNNVSPGDAFTIAGTNVIYDVASVQSNTQLTLSAPYSGASAADVTYAITRDFTSPDNFPELVVGDIETPTILTRSIRKIQQRFNEASDYSDQSIADHEALPDPHPQYLSDTRYEQDRLRESLLKEATLNLDFANNKYEVYEGPVDNLTAKPFNDIVTFTRASGASARNAIGGLSPVLTDQQRLVGNREGLLIEEQRTNLTESSADPSTWTATDFSAGTITLTPGFTGVDGDPASAAEVSFSADVENSAVIFGGTSVAGQSHTGSVYVDTLGVPLTLGLRFGGAEELVQLEAKTGFQRVAVSYVPDAGEPLFLKCRPATGTSSGPITIRVCAPQLEAGSFPTSYIKTEGSQVTRSADNASVDTLTPWFNTSGFTIFVDFNYTDVSANSEGQSVFQIDDGTPSNRILVYNRGASSAALLVIGPSGTNVINAPVAANVVKLAISYKNGVFNASVNRQPYTLSSLLPEGLSQVLIGRGGGALTGGYKEFKHIPRALTATELEVLTS